MKRNVSIDVLRIFAIICVITSHFWGEYVDLASIPPFADGYIIGWTLKGVSYLGVNNFILISAYFMCKQNFRTDRLLKLWVEVEFYSLILYILAIIFGFQTFSLKSAVMAIFPVISSEYWFVTCYFGLMLLVPFLNKFILSLTKRQFQLLILTMFTLFSVIPNLFFYSVWLNFGNGCGIVWFITLYFIGAYIRIYDVKIDNKLKCLAVLFMFLPVISRLFFVIVEKMIFGKVFAAGLFYGNNTIIVAIASVLVFLLFKSFEINTKIDKQICKISSCSFAVYLIHNNPSIKMGMWNVLSRIAIPSYFIRYIVYVSIIYIVCVLIDLIRQAIFKFNYSNKFTVAVDEKINDILDENG